MDPIRKQVYLILLGVAALAIGAAVLYIAKNTTDHLLGIVAVAGGLAIIIVSLPEKDE